MSSRQAPDYEKYVVGEANALPKLNPSFCGQEFVHWSNQLFAKINNSLAYEVLMGSEVAPPNPRFEADGVTPRMKADGVTPIVLKVSVIKDYDDRLEKYKKKTAYLWSTLSAACEPHCRTILSDVTMFDFSGLWNSIKTYFNRTKSASNYIDAKNEFDNTHLILKGFNHLTAYDTYVSSITQQAETIRHIHKREIRDIDMIHQLSKELPRKPECINYYAFYLIVKKWDEPKQTWLAATASIRDDIRDKYREELDDGDNKEFFDRLMSGEEDPRERTIEVSNLVRNGNAKRTKGQQLTKGTEKKTRTSEQTYSAGGSDGKPLHDKYRGCYSCGGLDHRISDCPMQQMQQQQGGGGGHQQQQLRGGGQQYQQQCPPQQQQYQQSMQYQQYQQGGGQQQQNQYGGGVPQYQQGVPAGQLQTPQSRYENYLKVPGILSARFGDEGGGRMGGGIGGGGRFGGRVSLGRGGGLGRGRGGWTGGRGDERAYQTGDNGNAPLYLSQNRLVGPLYYVNDVDSFNVEG